MIILSDSLTEKMDEGQLKVANHLAKMLKAFNPGCKVVSYGRRPTYCDVHLNLNKLFLNYDLYRTIRDAGESVLYMPFASNTAYSTLRTVILSLFAYRRVCVLFAQRKPMGLLARLALRICGAKVVSLSAESHTFFRKIVGDRALYLKTGIDTQKFAPVDLQVRKELREKHRIAQGMPVVMHVGHLKAGRNVDKLLLVDERFFVLLVVSSLTLCERDRALETALTVRPNTRIVYDYMPEIQELYQLSDVYLFPVQEAENCIDVPLSALEAAACGVPVVTTRYGELRELVGRDGFFEVENLDAVRLNAKLEEAISARGCDPRSSVSEYDWQNSLKKLSTFCG